MFKLFNLKIVFADEYNQLKEDWEKQNIEIDRLTAERNRKQKTLEILRGVLEENEKVNNAFAKTIDKMAVEKQDLLDIIAKLEADLEDKEKQRHKTAAKLGGYQKEINKLKDQVDFLKTNRRAPNLEELKNYTQRRKKVQ